MTDRLTTLNDMLKVLKTQDANLSLVFATAEGEIGGGYHVTELKQTSITSIDCGRNIDDWRETHVQLLDGQNGDHMSIGKFSSIAAQSIVKLHGLGDAPLYFEFALKNKGLRRYQVESLTSDGDQASILLSEGRAMCKPAAVGKMSAKSTECCGATNARTACCG
ncbi:DUF6428 family protein [Parasedimentitalea psychrophila]|uniref:DUF6428 family protein n=1 Tax=Parasedimentitalea psychrophila TaxID=2997337 RepID=A0A9Y2P828_9RHOB|nr:DUF6428 family protein [Parasedimentitalea psychrophila]WIY26643.1 DUF6428 family protein [Parasedimentitalea psychrophila]